MTDTTSPIPPTALPADPVEGAAAEAGAPRNIRSFVRRTGRTTIGQAKAFADVGPQFLLP